MSWFQPPIAFSVRPRRPASLKGFRPFLEPLEARSLLATFFVATTGDNTNDGLSAATPFLTVQHALDVAATPANSGLDTIQVAAGTYVEQLSVTSDVMLLGAGAGATTIRSPATLVASALGTNIIELSNMANVTMSGFTVSGPPNGFAATFTAGILVGGNANLILSATNVASVRNDLSLNFASGSAIRVGAPNGTPGTAMIQGVNVTDFQKTGIFVNLVGSTATITNTTITGAGPTGRTAQNGMQISRGAVATVTGSTISNNRFSGTTGELATGILLFEDTGTAPLTRATLTNNTFSNTDVGISNDSATGPTFINGNMIMNSGIGVRVDGRAQGPTSVMGNVITGNGTGVVVVGSTSGHVISQNSIFGNTGLGIDLGNDGVTPNDPLDPDLGPNFLQNFPVLDSASSSASGTVIVGTLNAIPNMSHRIEFFASSAANPSGFGEGQTFLGFVNVTTDSSGNASFTFTTPIVQPDGAAISATATDAAQSTSEFSQVVFVVFTPDSGLACEVTTLNVPGVAGTVELLDDADNPGSGALVVTGTARSDVIVVEPRPSNRSQLRVLLNGRTVSIVDRNSVRHIVVFAGAGNDTVVVNASLTIDATLFGGAGNDVLVGARGADGLDGGIGIDVLIGLGGQDTICGGNGNDSIFGGNGNDTVGGDAGIDKVFGENGNDVVLGGDGNDFLYGGIGNDQLFGQAGNDFLFGENGNDSLVGGAGNDQLFGGVGRDLLIGGDGSDQLFGEPGDDILVAGSTTFDENQDALVAIEAEWTSSKDYATRVTNIRSGGGANGTFVLDSTTVIDDGVSDLLWGQGGQDWFLVGSKDKIKDRSPNELVN